MWSWYADLYYTVTRATVLIDVALICIRSLLDTLFDLFYVEIVRPRCLEIFVDVWPSFYAETWLVQG